MSFRYTLSYKHRTDSSAIPALYRATPSATSEHYPGLIGSSPIPPPFVASSVSSQLRPLPSSGIPRPPRYCGPFRHPKRPSLTLTSCQLIPDRRSPLGLPVLRLIPLTCMPSPLPRQDGGNLFAHTVPSTSTFPLSVGSAPASFFEACSAFTHVTACTLAESSSRPSSTGGFSSFVTSTAAPIATGRNEQFPGGICTHCGLNAFHGARGPCQ